MFVFMRIKKIRLKSIIISQRY